MGGNRGKMYEKGWENMANRLVMKCEERCEKLSTLHGCGPTSVREYILAAGGSTLRLFTLEGLGPDFEVGREYNVAFSKVIANPKKLEGALDDTQRAEVRGGLPK